MNAHTNKVNNRRLTIKLIGYLFIFSMLYTAITSGLKFQKDYENEVNKVNDSFIQFEKTVLKQLSFSLWQMDDAQLKIQLEAALKLKGVVYIEIIEKNKSLVKVGISQIDDFKEMKFDLKYNSSDISSKLGNVVVQVSYKNIINDLSNNVVNLVVGELVKFLVLGLLLLIIVHQLIIKHLIKMADYTNKIDIDHLDKPLKLNKKIDKRNQDVIDNVADSINQMRKKLLVDIEQMEVVQEKL